MPGDSRKGADDHPNDVLPFLTIPYWNAPVVGSPWDDGEIRPLPSQVVSYECQSIHAGPYTPGQPLDVSVDVLNSGGGSVAVLVTVVVYWADPTVGFANPNFFAASIVPAPPSRTSFTPVTTPTMTATIPASAPAHVCLLARVFHTQDPSGGSCDPIGDRHWAQHNLQAVVLKPSGKTVVHFMVANPFPVRMAFDLEATHDARAHAVLRSLGRVVSGGRPVMHLRTKDDGAQSSDVGHWATLPVTLAAHERRPFEIVIALEGDALRPGEGVIVELNLREQRGRNDREPRSVGSLGIVVQVPPT